MADDNVDTTELYNKRIHLEEVTRNFFSKWYRRLLRWTLRKLILQADELRDETWGKSTCGCYVDDIINTLCFWHSLDAYLR